MTIVADQASPTLPRAAQAPVLPAGLAVLFGFWAVGVFAAVTAYLGYGAGLATVAALALLASFSPRLAIATLLVVTIFQNLALAFFSPALADAQGFALAQGANYLVAAVVFAKLVVVDGQWRSRRLAGLLIALALVGAYALLGAMRFDFVGAAAYFRLFTVPILALAIGYHLRDRIDVRFLRRLIRMLALIVLALIFFEVLFGAGYYDIFNLPEFRLLKRPGDPDFTSLETFVETSRRSLFNFTGQLRLDLRFNMIYGPSVHPISTAYIVAGLGVALFFFRSYMLWALCGLALILISAKGPIVLYAMPVLCTLALRRGHLPRRRPFLLVGLYAALVVAYGLYTQDVHVRGLLDGLASLITAPWGHGLGEGGNLSSGVLSAKVLGEVLPAPVESAIGVMAYQMGVLALVVLAILWRAFQRILGRSGSMPKLYLLSAFLVLLCNGAFQEEAFAPGAFGLTAMLLVLLSASLPANADNEGK